MPIDPYWRYATRDGTYAAGGGSRKWKCKFCGYEKTGSVTRVKDHWGKVPSKDVSLCHHVPDDVLASLEGWRRQQLGVDTGSDEVEHAMQTPASGEASSSRVAPSKRTRVKRDVDNVTVLASSSMGEGSSGRRTPLPSVEVIDEIKTIWQKRWDWFHRPLHAVVHVLHPLWRSEDQSECEELEEGFQTYVERWCGGDVEMLQRIEDDLLAFRNNTDNFTRATAKLRETQLQPVSWWKKYGNDVPTLKRFAIRVLSQDCSSGSCERNWSTWALYHTKRKNKLTTAQLERLVYCNCNLKLLERAAMGLEPMQVNVGKIDIEKVRDIPTIPQEERDLYTLLYEETSTPAHDTRGTRRGRGSPAAASTSAIVGDVTSSCSEEDDESHEDSEKGQTPRMPVIRGDEPEIFWRLDLLFFSCSI
ncbi:hypothetical protein L7F22_030382 [Adiantum nelumboides]|nr:hypothetical protein [Adiantum nelumboides]